MSDRPASASAGGFAWFPARWMAKGLQPVSRYGFTINVMTFIDVDQAPEACTLPTTERPLRVAEFDRLFAREVAAVERLSPQAARITLPPSPETAAEAAHLVVRETQCCSFFTFSLTATGGRLHLDVAVPESQTPVLDAVVGWVERVGTA